MRQWQKNDVGSKSSDIQLHRPEPPQLKEFIASQGTFTFSHLSEVESKQIQGIIDYLCPYENDGYYIRRWLWTQFPLIAVSFENLFLKKMSTKNTIVNESDGTGSSLTGVDAKTLNGTVVDSGSSTITRPNNMSSSDSSPNGAGSKGKDKQFVSNNQTISDSSVHRTKPVVVLPKALATLDKKRIIARHSPKKSTSLEYLNPEERGAFDFTEESTDDNGKMNLSIPVLKVATSLFNFTLHVPLLDKASTPRLAKITLSSHPKKKT